MQSVWLGRSFMTGSPGETLYPMRSESGPRAVHWRSNWPKKLRLACSLRCANRGTASLASFLNSSGVSARQTVAGGVGAGCVSAHDLVKSAANLDHLGHRGAHPALGAELGRGSVCGKDCRMAIYQRVLPGLSGGSVASRAMGGCWTNKDRASVLSVAAQSA